MTGAAYLDVVGANDLRGVASNDLSGVRIGAIDEHLDLGGFAARDATAEIHGNHESAARFVGGEGILRLLIGGPRNDMEAEGTAESVDEFLGSERGIEILHDDGEIVDSEGNGGSLQQEQHHGKDQGEGHGEPIAQKLREFLAGLSQDTSHVRATRAATFR